jgi:hypothetical protein
MLVMLDDEYWSELLGDSPEDLAHLLRYLSRKIEIKRYLKSRRGPKKKIDKPPRTRPKTHVPLGKILKKTSTTTPRKPWTRSPSCVL